MTTHSGTRPTFSFALKYALSELFPTRRAVGDGRRAGSARPDWIGLAPLVQNILSIMVPIATGLVIAGFVWGGGKVVRGQINSEDARRIDANALSAGGDLGGVVPLSLVARLAQLPDVEGAYPWSAILHQFKRKNGSVTDPGLQGRTIAPGDPYLHAAIDSIYPSADSAEFFGASSGIIRGSIIVTTHFLKSLGYNAGEIPPTIDLMSGGAEGTVYRLKVCGVPVRRSDGAREFYLSHEIEDKIQHAALAPSVLDSVRVAFLGPLPHAMATEFVDILKSDSGGERSRHVEAVTRQGASWIQIECTDDSVRDHAAFVGLANGATSTFEARHHNSLSKQEKDAIMNDDWVWGSAEERARTNTYVPTDSSGSVSVYATNYDHVPALAESLGERGLTVNSQYLGSIFLRQTIENIGRKLLYLITFFGVCGAFASISLTVGESIRRKTREIGVFKAFGARNSLLRTIYCIEAATVWFIAATLGICLAEAVGRAVEPYMHAHVIRYPGKESLFYLPWTLLVAVAIAALGLSIGASMLAATRAVRLQPVDALRE